MGKSRNSGNVVVESIGGANLTTGNGNGLGIPTSSHNLGPNVVLVNTSNSGPVPLQVQQILQQTQVSGSHSLSNNIVSVALSQAMGAAGVTPRTSPHILDNALTAAVNEAISTDMM